MKRVHPVFAVGLLGAALLGVVSFRAAVTAADAPPAGPPATPGFLSRPGEVPHLELQGVASCAASGCHGAGASRPKKGSEYSIWVERDPHRRAYGVLAEPRSTRMQEILIAGGQAPKGQCASDNPVCLKCHALGNNGAPIADARRHQLLSAEGVTCEACHGPAERWLTPHYKPEWKTLSPAAKQEMGFVNTKNLVVRSWVCAECHAGAPAQEVNHNLLAAGHPVLKFEMAAFHDLYPKHWDERPTPDLDTQLWSVGQLVSAEAAVRLTNYRSHLAATGRSRDWPELSEYDCFACHHDLLPTSRWRQSEKNVAGRRPGSIPYSHWYTGRLEKGSASPAGLFLAGLGGDDARRAQDDLEALRGIMNVSRPNPARAEARSRQTAAALRAWTERVYGQALGRGLPPDARQAATEELERAGERGEVGKGYDQAVQFYLGLAAFHRDAPPSPGRRELLLRLRKSLAYPSGYDSPRSFVPPPLAPELPADPGSPR